MRVITPPRRVTPVEAVRGRRSAHLEMLGLAAVGLVVLLGLALASMGRLDGTRSDDGNGGAPVNLRLVRGPEELLPLLGVFDEPFERRAVAAALYRRLTSAPVEHVGGLASATIPAATVQSDRRYVRLRERLASRPGLVAVPALASADLAQLKPAAIVRTAAEFRERVACTAAWFLAAFGLAHGVRRWRGTIGDPVALPVVMLLCGIGLTSLVALRDPLRDTMAFWPSLTGISLGLAALVVVSEIDIEASRLRRAVLGPLAIAVTLAILLLLFGTGPGGSGARLRLLGFQPADVIRLSVVLALAAHFARRGEFLREYSEDATPSRPWLGAINVPRWKDVGPALVTVGIVVAFFFLQRDLGPALVLACVFLGLYGVARRRGVLVTAGLALVLCAFAFAWWTGVPATVRQRVAIWIDPWQNGVTGGDQVAHGLWALATGASWGSGLGRGAGAMVPAGDTDFILAVTGEEIGFLGLAVLVALYCLLCWRCLRTAVRAPGEYSALVALGVALSFVVQAGVIASGVLGLLPLSGVVTPFLSYGRSAMVANFLALGIVLAIGRRAGAARPQWVSAARVVATVLAVAGAAVLARAAWVQVLAADATATTASLTEQGDGGLRFEYNPRLLDAARLIERGTIYDRRGLPLATSRPAEITGLAAAYRKAGLEASACPRGAARCYPLGPAAFHVLGDWNTGLNWAATNSSYVERDSDAVLKGFDDHPHLVDVVRTRTGERSRAMLRDYREVLPLARDTFSRRGPAVRALLTRNRDVRLSLDARLQARAAAAVRTRMEAGGHTRGAAVVLDVESGAVLASVTYPLPATAGGDASKAFVKRPGAPDPLLDRARYGLYPPGSTFKMLVAAAAMRTGAGATDRTFACVRLPDGRVGNFVRGWSRPVRDDPMDHSPHGDVDLRRGLVVSCNAYFAQLALALGPQPILDAASLFGIDAARPATPARVARTLAHAGYGQGEVLASPLEMARVAAAVARDGTVAPVRWTADADPAARPADRLLSPAQAGVLGRYLREVVTSGTGRALAGNPVPIAGKTGTAEIDGAAAHSWFTGFAPFGGTRRVAFAVIVENAGYGARSAAPIAGDLVTAARELELVR